jgi:hypothetical protein
MFINQLRYKVSSSCSHIHSNTSSLCKYPQGCDIITQQPGQGMAGGCSATSHSRLMIVHAAAAGGGLLIRWVCCLAVLRPPRGVLP